MPEAHTAAHRRTQAAMAGFLADSATARQRLDDCDPAVRCSSLRALTRLGDLSAAELHDALADGSAMVRVTALELAARRADVPLAPIVAALGDDAAPVVEAAAWAVGEKSSASTVQRSAGEHEDAQGREDAVAALVHIAGEHEDALCRESCVAALGAIGDGAGLHAVLAALQDRPEVRRRAVIALVAFEGPEVEAALARAANDRDRQVRAAAEELGFERSAEPQ